MHECLREVYLARCNIISSTQKLGVFSHTLQGNASLHLQNFSVDFVSIVRLFFVDEVGNTQDSTCKQLLLPVLNISNSVSRGRGDSCVRLHCRAQPWCIGRRLAYLPYTLHTYHWSHWQYYSKQSTQSGIVLNCQRLYTNTD